MAGFCETGSFSALKNLACFVKIWDTENREKMLTKEKGDGDEKRTDAEGLGAALCGGSFFELRRHGQGRRDRDGFQSGCGIYRRLYDGKCVRSVQWRNVSKQRLRCGLRQHCGVGFPEQRIFVRLFYG